MKVSSKILMMLLLLAFSEKSSSQNYAFQFYDETFNFKVEPSINIEFKDSISQSAVKSFYQKLNSGNYHSVLDTLLAYKKDHLLNDWFYYQLIRKTVQQIAPKEENYERYTLYKWFLLAKSGYDTRLALGKNQMMFYVWSDEDISDIPYFKIDGKKYFCLNFHDYINASYQKDKIYYADIQIENAERPFSYHVTQIPDFKPEDYKEKLIQFDYRQKAYHFKIKLNADMQAMFINYPGVDFESYFNIPLSKETYSSLIPLLKQNVAKMNEKNGVDYLMKFTRNAFLYENDEEHFGKEKRLSPEQTLFYTYSDCDDRAALFFYLIKEIYDLPMIALLYPTHITMAVQFKKPVGKPIIYEGKEYSVCEPTPQKKNLKIGQLANQYKNISYVVVYQYDPQNAN